ncbi:uncharacterized protein PHALS_06861 [Plasmopara halstedii]|uniref:Uncharacterized protein n=1 Tax=Plasmopara halstedii TaxID=4781 RepID=A0A0N7L873_PLAHL|nr:uncharacterized protein PHALS_06861 [Plasmopara halstedii]CEG49075.1 hypothetical protein PHALS_06861 [Plasmopara halstedii]|eukprot:XP_024585444.1 hypothetical protein PHALS_06861 [Plasmopara halstedii]
MFFIRAASTTKNSRFCRVIFDCAWKSQTRGSWTNIRVITTVSISTTSVLLERIIDRKASEVLLEILRPEYYHVGYGSEAK